MVGRHKVGDSVYIKEINSPFCDTVGAFFNIPDKFIIHRLSLIDY